MACNGGINSTIDKMINSEDSKYVIYKFPISLLAWKAISDEYFVATQRHSKAWQDKCI